MSAGSSFSLNIRAWVDKAKGQGDLVLRKVAMDMGARVVLRSPVDTGRFRGNWQFGIGAGDVSALMSAVHSKVDPVDKSGQSSIARINAGAAAARLGDVIYISNNLPYARRLEYGWSKQAPEGMVRLTVQEFQAAVNRAATP